MGTDGDVQTVTSPKTCKHYVKRKKRFCKMTVAKGREYCGEHETSTLEKGGDDKSKVGNRIPCPLDPKHTVYRFNLKKHLKICNARPKALPEYIVNDVNNGTDQEDFTQDTRVKLCDIPAEQLNALIMKIEKSYKDQVNGNLSDMCSNHEVLRHEIENPAYGSETLKHLVQTSSILGGLKDMGMLEDNSSYVEFGAGKGQVAFWLAKSIQAHKNSNVILVDKASHRHKKDNKLEDRESVQRIRANIADFEMRKLESLRQTKRVVGVGKHLCGGATDLALRCLLHASQTNETNVCLEIQGFLIAVCCHHRCDWRSFVGKEVFLEHGFDKNDFNIIIKMVSWAICGDGLSRERRKKLAERTPSLEHDELFVTHSSNERSDITRERRAEIGFMCKRLIDYCRQEYMRRNSFQCYLKYYVKSDITLENVCIVGHSCLQTK